MELTPGLHFLRTWKSLISFKSEATFQKLSFYYHSQPPLLNIAKSKSVTDETINIDTETNLSYVDKKL